jgi:ferredoxin-fold anticodon binding domain-containing protein
MVAFVTGEDVCDGESGGDTKEYSITRRIHHIDRDCLGGFGGIREFGGVGAKVQHRMKELNSSVTA